MVQGGRQARPLRRGHIRFWRGRRGETAGTEGAVEVAEAGLHSDAGWRLGCHDNWTGLLDRTIGRVSMKVSMKVSSAILGGNLLSTCPYGTKNRRSIGGAQCSAVQCDKAGRRLFRSRVRAGAPHETCSTLAYMWGGRSLVRGRY